MGLQWMAASRMTQSDPPSANASYMDPNVLASYARFLRGARFSPAESPFSAVDSK